MSEIPLPSLEELLDLGDSIKDSVGEIRAGGDVAEFSNKTLYAASLLLQHALKLSSATVAMREMLAHYEAVSTKYEGEAS